MKRNKYIILGSNKNPHFKSLLDPNDSFFNQACPTPNYSPNNSQSLFSINKQNVIKDMVGITQSSNTSPIKDKMGRSPRNSMNMNRLVPNKSPVKEQTKTLNSKIANLQSKLRGIEKQKQGLIRYNYEISEKNKELQKYNVQLMKQINQINAEFSKAIKINRQLQTQIDKYQRLVDKKYSNNTSETSIACEGVITSYFLQDSKDQIKMSLFQKQQKIIKMEQQLKSRQEELESRKTQYEHYLKQLKDKYNQSVSECSTLQGQLDAYRIEGLRKQESYQRKIESLQKQIQDKNNTLVSLLPKPKTTDQYVQIDSPKDCQNCKQLLTSLLKITNQISQSKLSTTTLTFNNSSP